ncbi:ABC transporter G family member 40-like [Coffea eugenioides]|uniref:ABC transporter G family member 40-like n=1 Tax=Coffea eugenioides TaxID=49369 RepID=UPI000F610319|nr:ABC transporter G family member 40-like [Coffea eugenioides]
MGRLWRWSMLLIFREWNSRSEANAATFLKTEVLDRILSNKRMPQNSPNSSPKSRWSPIGDTSIEETYSSRPSSVCRTSVVSDKTINFTSEYNFETPRTILQTPIYPGNSTPDIRQTIQNASPGTAKSIAFNMYQSLKQHGLRDEIGRAFTRDRSENEEIRSAEEDSRRGEELLGMEYILRDGFVSYLRDVAKITPPIPQEVIRFSGISYAKKFEIPSNKYETFGNKVVGWFTGPFKKIFQCKNSTWIDILKGVDGYIMPGSMTLLLGPPGCGKSTLLEILAGRAKGDKNSHLQGVVMYNDKYASEVHLSRLVAYVSGQLNKHIPFLSVRETLEFARDCSQTLRPENFTPQMRKFFAHALVEGQDPFLEYILEILNLKNIEHKLTGEAISDTDRQKLTTAELALGTYAVMLYDQPLSGSDLAATYDLADTIRTVCRIQQSSAIMSLTHLSQEIFDLFDRIILLGDGHVVFQGPRQDAVPYFNKLGYEKPLHVESAEFLEDIVAGYGSRYIAPEATPLSIDQLVGNYRNSDHYKDIIRIVTKDKVKHTYWIETEPGLGLSLKTPSTYSSLVDAKPRKLTELVVSKISSKVGQSGGIESTGRVQIGDIVTALSVNGEESTYLALGPQRHQHEHASHAYSTLKKAVGHIRIQVERYETKEESYQPQWEKSQTPFTQTWLKSTKTLIGRQIKITKRLQILLMLRLFQAMILGLFTGTLFYKLGGQYDQQKMNSVRALGFVSTMSIMLINLAASYTFSMYFLVGLSFSGKGTALVEYLLLLFLVAYFGSSVFFFLSAVSSIPETGNALAGLLVSIFILFSGFVIYPSNIPTYWKWLTYINPIRWANISYCRSQFQYYDDPCSNYKGQFPFCDQFPSNTVGKAYLLYYELLNDNFGPWFPYAVLIGWTAVMTILALCGLKTLEFKGLNQSLPHLKRSSVVSNFRKDKARELSSSGSASDQDLYPTMDTRPNILPPGVKVTDDRGVERWIEDIAIDMERRELGIPVEPVSFMFEDLSFTRYLNKLNFWLA